MVRSAAHAYVPPDWKGRMEWTIRLFNEGRFDHCILDCRTMLLYEDLPFLYRIYCRTLLVASLDDWNEAEEERVVAEKIWAHLYYMYPRRPCHREDCLNEVRDILDDLAEDMDHDCSIEDDNLSTGNYRHRRKKVSRKRVTASTSQAPTNHAVSAAKATAETAFPTRYTTTLAVRSRGPIEEDGTAVRRDSVFDKTTLQDRLSASAGHDQDSALDASTDKDVAMSDE